MNTRVKQVLLVTVGAAVAVVMVFLGLWQMQVFVDKGNKTVQDRAAQAPVPLSEHVSTAGEVGDIYGKRVTITGEYLPERQVLVAGSGSARVLTGFRVADGRVLPVVRGSVGPAGVVPAPPAGQRTEVGLFLPGEGDADAAAPAGMLGSVRMPLLAQRWPEQLIPGFVTLDDAAAAAHGLQHADVQLPTGEGSAQNSGYALQWWVFAAFALGFSLKIAHGLGARERRRQADALAAPAAPNDRKDSDA